MSERIILPEPPYYAAIFSNQRTDVDEDSYQEMAARMMELAAQQPGYLGADSARGEGGFGITVSYWRDLGSIKDWKNVGEHQEAQRLGKARWYKNFTLRVAKVERSYDFK